MRTAIVLAGVLAVASATLPPAARAETAGAQPADSDARHHELACTAATVGGAVVGVAVGSLFGGGLGRSLFEAAGAGLGIAGGRHLKC